MLLEVTCKCGKTYPVSDRHTGKVARCALCGAELRIPRLGDPGVIARPIHDEPRTWEPRPLPEGAVDHRPSAEALPLDLEESPPSAATAPAAPPSARHAHASSPATATPPPAPTTPPVPPVPPAPAPSSPRTPPSPHVVTPRARRRISPVTLGLGALAVLLLFAVMGTAYVVYLTYSDMPPDPNASPSPMVAAPAPPTATPASPPPAETPPATPAAVAAPAVAPTPAEPVPASTPPSEPSPAVAAANPAPVPTQPAPPSPEPVAKPAPVETVPVMPVTLDGKLTGTWRNIAGQDLELELRRDGTFVIRRPEQLPRSGFPWTVEPDDKPGFVRLNVGGDAAVVRLSDDANTLSALRDGQEIPVFQRKSEP